MTGKVEPRAPKRVLHIGKYFPPHRGGMETYLKDLMNLQHSLGYSVTALVHTSSNRILSETITVENQAQGSYCVTAVGKWFSLGVMPVSPFFLWSAIKKVRQFKPEVIHLHLPNAFTPWLPLISLFTNAKWMCSWHSDVITPQAGVPMRLLYKTGYKPLETILLRTCEKIFASSAAYAAGSEALSKYAKKIVIEPLGLDTTRLPDPTKVKALPKNADTNVILCVGRHSPYKGTLSLIEAFSRLQGAELWLAGPENPDKTLQRRALECGCSERVKHWGNVSDSLLWRLYKTCDLFCLPSDDKAEAYGLVLLEAAHFGKPILARDIPGSGVPWVTHTLGGATFTEGNFTLALADSLEKRKPSALNILLSTPSY